MIVRRSYQGYETLIRAGCWGHWLQMSRRLAKVASCSRELYLTERMTRIVRTNYSCEHSHSRECEYSGQNYYANVRANCSRE